MNASRALCVVRMVALTRNLVADDRGQLLVRPDAADPAEDAVDWLAVALQFQLDGDVGAAHGDRRFADVVRIVVWAVGEDTVGVLLVGKAHDSPSGSVAS